MFGFNMPEQAENVSIHNSSLEVFHVYFIFNSVFHVPHFFLTTRLIFLLLKYSGRGVRESRQRRLRLPLGARYCPRKHRN